MRFWIELEQPVDAENCSHYNCFFNCSLSKKHNKRYDMIQKKKKKLNDKLTPSQTSNTGNKITEGLSVLCDPPLCAGAGNGNAMNL